MHDHQIAPASILPHALMHFVAVDRLVVHNFVAVEHTVLV